MGDWARCQLLPTSGCEPSLLRHFPGCTAAPCVSSICQHECRLATMASFMCRVLKMRTKGCGGRKAGRKGGGGHCSTLRGHAQQLGRRLQLGKHVNCAPGSCGRLAAGNKCSRRWGLDSPLPRASRSWRHQCGACIPPRRSFSVYSSRPGHGRIESTSARGGRQAISCTRIADSRILTF